MGVDYLATAKIFVNEVCDDSVGGAVLIRGTAGKEIRCNVQDGSLVFYFSVLAMLLSL